MTEEQIRFLKSYDFMRVGQAMTHGQWQSAAMTVRRMEQKAKDVEFTDYLRLLSGLRQAVMRKNAEEGKRILAHIVAKRVQMLNQIKSD